MTRKRKVPVRVYAEDDEVTENEDRTNVNAKQQGPIRAIMNNVQLKETYHMKYIKELQLLYEKMDHEAFIFTLIGMIQSAMIKDEYNEFAKRSLLFCAKFVCSYDGEVTHPVLISTFDWVLSMNSTSPHIRYRLCQFVNMILNALGTEAALDDSICDNIMSYMVNRLRDNNPSVRVQAILALQRLQMPDNPDDPILKTYQFHLSSDPSSKVRQAVITSMGRNYNTIPYIIERLWDVDDKVRRHTYLHMSSYPVKVYKVSQRLTFLEQGLTDRSESVRKVVLQVMLPQWYESYNKNFLSFISALKLDANEEEMSRFRKVTKLALSEMFKKQDVANLITILPLESEGEFYKCVSFENLSVDISLYWLCLIQFLHKNDADELDLIIPELSTFCAYILNYCQSCNIEANDKWAQMNYHYTLLTLMEIVSLYDLGDEIGRENLKKLINTILSEYDLEESIVEVIVRCTENLIINQEERLQFFVDIIKELIEPKTSANEFSRDRSVIEQLPDKSLQLKLSTLKVKILDLKEQEMILKDKKDYAGAEKVAQEQNACREEYANLLKPFINDVSTKETESNKSHTSLPQVKKLTTETILKCLQLSFHMIVSKKVKSLTLNVCELYKDFIRCHIESNQINIRDWALKCGTAYSMLYDQLSKDVYTELYSQFYKNHNIRIWKTSIECIFELLDRYGFSHFELDDKQNKSKKPGRQLYNTLGFLDTEEDVSTYSTNGVDLIFMMSHFLDSCEDICIISAVVNGFCRLILHGHMKNDGIMEKLLLKYFNPITEPEINQMLGVFYENLIIRKKQEYLQPALLPTVTTILSAPYDSPLHEIKPAAVIKFVIDSTRPITCSPGLNIHNTIALTFMHELQNSSSNKDLIKVLARELVTLDIPLNDDKPLRNDLKTCCEQLLKCNLDGRTEIYIKNFIEILDGKRKKETAQNQHDSDEETLNESANMEKNDNTKENAGNSEIAGQDKLPVIEEVDNTSSTDKDGCRTTESNRETLNNTENEGNVTIVQIAPNENSENDLATNKSPNSSENKENLTPQKETEKSIEKSSLSVEQIPTPPKSAGPSPKNKDSEQSHLDETSGNADLQADGDDLTSPNSNRESARDREENAEHMNTPTMYGRENTTTLRYLRKSMNLRQNSPTDSIMPAKQKKDSAHNTRTNSNNTNSNKNSYKKKELPIINIDNSCSSRRSNENIQPNEIAILDSNNVTKTSSINALRKNNIRSSNKSNNRLNESDEICPSPEAIQTSRVGRKLRSRRPNKDGTVDETKVGQSSVKRSLDFTTSKRPLSGDEINNIGPIRKHSKLSIEISENNSKTISKLKDNQKPNQNNKNRIKAKEPEEKKNEEVEEMASNRKTRIKTLTNNVDKNISPKEKNKNKKLQDLKCTENNAKNSKSTEIAETIRTPSETVSKTRTKQNGNANSTKKRSEVEGKLRNPALSEINANSGTRTRSTAKKDFQLNNIMTRKRLSLNELRTKSPTSNTNDRTEQLMTPKSASITQSSKTNESDSKRGRPRKDQRELLKNVSSPKLSAANNTPQTSPRTENSSIRTPKSIPITQSPNISASRNRGRPRNIQREHLKDASSPTSIAASKLHTPETGSITENSPIQRLGLSNEISQKQPLRISISGSSVTDTNSLASSASASSKQSKSNSQSSCTSSKSSEPVFKKLNAVKLTRIRTNTAPPIVISTQKLTTKSDKPTSRRSDPIKPTKELLVRKSSRDRKPTQRNEFV